MNEQICTLLRTAQKIAIIGAKDKPGSDVDRVGRYLIHEGYTVFPVHPVRKNVWKQKTYATLGAIGDTIDIVCLFRASEFCLAHAEETLCLPHKPTLFWMQLGISNTMAELILSKKGIQVISNKCIMVEHAICFDKNLAPHGAHGIENLSR